MLKILVRYPTTGEAPSAFAAKVHNASQSATSFTATAALSFLNSWTCGSLLIRRVRRRYNYLSCFLDKLGAELLTPFGRCTYLQDPDISPFS